MNTAWRLRSVILILAGVHLFGTVGFWLIEGWNLLDSLYMTVITISTVGFMEVHELTTQGRVFSIMLILVGVGGMMYGLTVFFQLLVEGQIRGILGKYKLQRGLRKMNDHYVVCGYGRVGRRVVNDLRHRGELTVVIENETELLDQMKEHMIPFVPGDATSDEVLRAAGVERAKGLIVGLPHEADTLFVTISARQMNPALRIVARSEQATTNAKLKIAGADDVVCPHDMGGERMALAVSQPNVLGHVQIGEDGAGHPVRIDQLRVDSASPLCGMEAGKLPLEAEFDITLIALQKSSGDLLVKIRPDDRVEEGDVLVLLGSSDKLMLLEHALPQAPQAPAPAPA